VKRYYENELAKELQITISLPRNGKTTKKKYAHEELGVRKWRLHPLIHTLLKFNLAQNVEKNKAEPKLRSRLIEKSLDGLFNLSV
jgi:hypothetical protein